MGRRNDYAPREVNSHLLLRAARRYLRLHLFNYEPLSD